jgi:hypothetical protein
MGLVIDIWRMDHNGSMIAISMGNLLRVKPFIPLDVQISPHGFADQI